MERSFLQAKKHEPSSSKRVKILKLKNFLKYIFVNSLQLKKKLNMLELFEELNVYKKEFKKKFFFKRSLLNVSKFFSKCKKSKKKISKINNSSEF